MLFQGLMKDEPNIGVAPTLTKHPIQFWANQKVFQSWKNCPWHQTIWSFRFRICGLGFWVWKFEIWAFGGRSRRDDVWNFTDAVFHLNLNLLSEQ